MAALTDLTFQQLSDKLPAGCIELVAAQPTATPPQPAKLKLDFSKLLGSSAEALTNAGVIKGLSLLLNGAYQAQTVANEGQIAGERLAAFQPPNAGNTTNGYVPLTRSMTSRHELATAVNIVGATN